MAFRILLILATFLLFVAASSTTAETITATTSTDRSALPSDISSLPDCGIECLSTAGKEIGCRVCRSSTAPPPQTSPLSPGLGLEVLILMPIISKFSY
ncbi:hypothetical protein BFJ71_g295 [Fusarium oxysporum]|nr:hypothetical protein BFJ71_g295 [Fusarium oxysporum]